MTDEQAVPAAERTTALQRMTFNLSPKVADMARRLAEENETSVTEIIRRSIVLSEYVEGALNRGARIYVAEPGGEMREVVFLR